MNLSFLRCLGFVGWVGGGNKGRSSCHKWVPAPPLSVFAWFWGSTMLAIGGDCIYIYMYMYTLILIPESGYRDPEHRPCPSVLMLTSGSACFFFAARGTNKDRATWKVEPPSFLWKLGSQDWGLLPESVAKSLSSMSFTIQKPAKVTEKKHLGYLGRFSVFFFSSYFFSPFLFF